MVARKFLIIGFILLAVGFSFVLYAEATFIKYYHVNIRKIFFGRIVPLPFLLAGLLLVITGLLEWKLPKKNANQ